MFPFSPAGFNPANMDPQTLRELTELMRELTPAQMQKIQTLMHNSMAGFDVRKEMEEFESSLPPGFREKMAQILYRAHGVGAPAPVPQASDTSVTPTEVTDLRQARLTLLRGVAVGDLTPEAALDLLFP